ncbi:hypothetical protein [Bacillus sp. UMB0728]|uniref:hypothetical protein n=1 Tax=Bacillus sp. UMB0728 TaxID=2066052 RepID=UPI000C75D9A5|nr:hypothetical protein [Bacillus sp. UMB0728]PLR74901.1 hypothetical protein CYJ37_04625 [Bacillus sp. UMB0728]
MRLRKLIQRKLTASFAVSAAVSILCAFFTVYDTESAPGLGTAFLSWLLFFMLYAGTIIFLYGNLVSFLLETLQKRVAILRKDWFYIFLHGLFGLANGLLFQNTIAALWGTGAALLYALLDRRLFKKEGSTLFIVLPLLCAGLLWGYFLLASDPLPPFTEK